MKENTNYIPTTLFLNNSHFGGKLLHLYFFCIVLYSILSGHITLSENKDLL